MCFFFSTDIVFQHSALLGLLKIARPGACEGGVRKGCRERCPVTLRHPAADGIPQPGRAPMLMGSRRRDLEGSGQGWKWAVTSRAWPKTGTSAVEMGFRAGVGHSHPSHGLASSYHSLCMVLGFYVLLLLFAGSTNTRLLQGRVTAVPSLSSAGSDGALGVLQFISLCPLKHEAPQHRAEGGRGLSIYHVECILHNISSAPGAMLLLRNQLNPTLPLPAECTSTCLLHDVTSPFVEPDASQDGQRLLPA